MESPVRMVCGGCLQSVEWDGVSAPPVLCPHCGGTIDSRLGELETPTCDYTRLLSVDPPRAGSTWDETWTKGSLGKVGRYQLRELIGDGGFGQVYQAYDPRLDRDVAVKVLKQKDPGERVKERFFREARAAARLAHPNIVSVLDSGCDDGRCWIVYEFVRGRTLTRVCDQEKVSVDKAVHIIRDLADALDHAHKQGVFHRDLKPANVLVDNQGRPHLTDFGLAKRADLDSDLTRDGAILGTPAYMSPEQANGRSNQADERSDVFSLGMMFYELLLGRRAAHLQSGVPVWRNKTFSPPPPPRSVNRKVPVALERICLRALATEPDERYPHARAFADDLDHWVETRHAAERFPRMLVGVAASIAVVALVAVLLQLLPAGERQNSALDGREPQPAPATSPTIASAAVPADEPALPLKTADSPTPALPTVKVVGNVGSKIYHYPDCSALSTLLTENRREFSSVTQALGEGFRHCNRCGHRHEGSVKAAASLELAR